MSDSLSEDQRLDMLNAANARLRSAAARLRRAQEDLDSAEIEQRQAVEAIEALEKTP